MNPDLITLACIAGMFSLGLAGWAVAHRALGMSDRHHQEALRASERAIRAESRASHYHALLGASVFGPVDTRPDPLGPDATRPLPRINARHEPPVRAGGRIRMQPQPLRGERDDT